MTTNEILIVRSDAAGTLLRLGRFSATRGAYHLNGYDPTFSWNVWDGSTLVDVATNRKDAEAWLRRQASQAGESA